MILMIDEATKAKVVRNLSKVRTLFRHKNNWTWGTQARDSLGRPVDPTDPDACCWCLIGALDEVDRDGVVSHRDVADVLGVVYFDSPFLGLASLNDHGGYDAVVEVLDKALEDNYA